MDTNKRAILTRTKYKDIKKYDHQQMERFLRIVYEEAYQKGFTAGTKTAPVIDTNCIEEAVKSVKGIGEVKAAAIMGAIKSRMKGGNNADQEPKQKTAV